MARRQQRPIHAEPIRDYDTLRRKAANFAKGAYSCLIFVGPPGRLKSTIITEANKNKAHVISGHAKPFEVFCELQEHKDEPIIIDDADGLYSDSQGQRLLKQLTNRKKPTLVSWISDAPVDRGLEKRFDTSSPVCLIDNAWNAQNEHIAALEDRARLFLFDPPPHELHRQMDFEDWFTDADIYNFIGDNLEFFDSLSVRLYEKALEEKEAGDDWKAYILKHINETDRHIVLIEYDDEWKNRPTTEKVVEFIRRTGSCRATYFNRRKRLMERVKGHRVVARWQVTPDIEEVPLPPMHDG